MSILQQRENADVIIVGAGIIGCATAYYLTRLGASVQVLDRGLVAGEQSGRAWGFVRQQSRHPAEIPLAREASRIWGELDRELEADVEFVRGGVLVPAATAEDEARLEASAQTAREHGIDVRMIGAREISEILPAAKLQWRAGLFSPEDGHAEPAAATRAYANAAKRRGAVIRERSVVYGFETTNGRVTGVATDEGMVNGGAVLCAAGAGAAELSRSVGLALPIQVVRGSVAQTRPTQPAIRTAVWSPHVAFRPKLDGTYYISNGYQDVDAEHDLTLASFRQLRLFLPTLLAHRKTLRLRLGGEFLKDLRRRCSVPALFGRWPEPKINRRYISLYEARFYEIFPHLNGLGLQRMWAGRIDATPDLIPIIGPARSPEGLFIAAGFNGHGFALGPIVGKLLAELIWKGRSSLDLHKFRLSRFAERDVTATREAL